jgi:hypothetical protein
MKINLTKLLDSPTTDISRLSAGWSVLSDFSQFWRDAMSLEDYKVQRDKFEPETKSYFAFPCYCCIHRFKGDNEEPCRTCDHNITSVDDDR